MIVAHISVTAPDGRRQEIVKALRSVLGPTRLEQGCIACDLVEEVDNPGVLHLVGRWQTQEDLERHLRSARYAHLLAIVEASAEPPQIAFHWVTASQGLSYVAQVRLGASSSCGEP
jgi:quinol monooxygenase YgiN